MWGLPRWVPWRGQALLLGGIVAGAVPAGATAQELALAERGPRFLYAATPKSVPKPVDVKRTPVLRQQVSLQRDGVTLRAALAAITEQTGLRFVFSRDEIATDTRVHLRAEQITVAAALTEILLDASVDVMFSSP